MTPLPRTSLDGADLDGWIVEQGLIGTSLSLLLDGLGERLEASGMPIQRVFLALPMISPDLRAVSHVWWRGRRTIREQVRHDDVQPFEVSPFSAMLEAEESFRRWTLATGLGSSGYQVLDMIAAEGGTDHLAYLVSFGTTKSTAMRGCAVSFTTDAAEGFSPADLACLERLGQVLGLAACRFALTELLGDVLGAYVGQEAGQRVLQGQIRRGEGHRVMAALMFADLRGFTAATAASGPEMITLLGEHLAAMAEPVEAAGGEVLKFLGDGLLAAFPVAGGDHGSACGAALSAAIDALARNARVNAARESVTLELDVALHLGEVFYGNIGAGSRLDFTVIGSAVNEASRLEGLCGPLDRSILMSADFARCCGLPVVSLGPHALRGVGTREVFALPGA